MGYGFLICAECFREKYMPKRSGESDGVALKPIGVMSMLEMAARGRPTTSACRCLSWPCPCACHGAGGTWIEHEPTKRSRAQ